MNAILSCTSWRCQIDVNIKDQGHRRELNPGKTKSPVTFEPFVLQIFALQFWKWQLNS